MPFYFWTCALIIFLTSVTQASEDAEQIFSRAKSYTVKIRSSVTVPFEGDSKGTAMGAGFVVDLGRHWIVTNAHVTTRSKALLRVASINRDFQEGRPVYIDPYFDIAVIWVENVKGLSEAKLECDDTPTTGLPVGAFGHPWIYLYTGTKGIISGNTADLKHFGDFLQTDAPINPGNSGGPLISLKTGKVVGINTAGLNDAQNMNYALPIKEVCTVLNLLRKGIDPTPPDFPFSFYKDNDDKNTLRIAKILPTGERLGAAVGDVVLTAGIDDLAVENEPQMLNALRGQNERSRFVVKRGDQEVTLSGALKVVPGVFGKRGLLFSGLLLRRSYNEEFLTFFGKEYMLDCTLLIGGNCVRVV